MKYFQYHDSKLVEIIFHWEFGTARLQILSSEGIKNFELENIKKIEISRNHPWGKSLVINEMDYIDSLLKIEMQSGDIIQIEGNIIEQ